MIWSGLHLTNHNFVDDAILACFPFSSWNMMSFFWFIIQFSSPSSPAPSFYFETTLGIVLDKHKP